VIEETLLEAGDKMDKAVEVAKEDFASIRTGRASNAGASSRNTINTVQHPATGGCTNF
jgi:ribosome recycling factor